MRGKHGEELIMQVHSSGKRSSRSREEEHLDLPCKKFQVSKGDEETSNAMVEAVKQPRHDQ